MHKINSLFNSKYENLLNTNLECEREAKVKSFNLYAQNWHSWQTNVNLIANFFDIFLATHFRGMTNRWGCALRLCVPRGGGVPGATFVRHLIYL